MWSVLRHVVLGAFDGVPETDKTSLFEFNDELDIDLNPCDFARLAGKVCLVVNVASR